MKTILLLFLFSFAAFSQEYIQKNDGTKIQFIKGTLRVEPVNKRLTYKVGNEKKALKIKYKDLDHASFEGFLFKTFQVSNIRKGYYLLAEDSQKTLAVISRKRTSNSGGFDSVHTRYEMVLFGKDKKIIEELSFTDNKSEKNAQFRTRAKAIIKENFSSCPKVMERLYAVNETNKKLENGDVLNFLNKPIYISCN